MRRSRVDGQVTEKAVTANIVRTQTELRARGEVTIDGLTTFFKTWEPVDTHTNRKSRSASEWLYWL